MKVKISYTVDIEDIPEEINRLSDRLASDLDNLVRSVSDFGQVDPMKLDERVNRLEHIRTSMAESDVLMADLQMILRGYMGVLSSPPVHIHDHDIDSRAEHVSTE